MTLPADGTTPARPRRIAWALLALLALVVAAYLPGLGGGFARADAVRDSHAAVCAAGDEEAGERGQPALDRVDARKVADAVLRHRGRMARQPRQDGRRGDAERLLGVAVVALLDRHDDPEALGGAVGPDALHVRDARAL